MNKQVAELTLAEAQLEAALAEGLCHTCGGEGGIGPEPLDRIICPKFLGTGRVPLLPRLRKPCINNRDDEDAWCMEHPGCSGGCRGRGWLPETNGWKAMDVAKAAMPGHSSGYFDSSIGGVYFRLGLVEGFGDTTELAFWRALVAWCRAQEVNREPIP